MYDSCVYSLCTLTSEDIKEVDSVIYLGHVISRGDWGPLGHGVHWDTPPPLLENIQYTEPMICHFLEPPLYKSIRTKTIVQYKKVGELKQLFDPSS